MPKYKFKLGPKQVNYEFSEISENLLPQLLNRPQAEMMFRDAEGLFTEEDLKKEYAHIKNDPQIQQILRTPLGQPPENDNYESLEGAKKKSINEYLRVHLGKAFIKDLSDKSSELLNKLNTENPQATDGADSAQKKLQFILDRAGLTENNLLELEKSQLKSTPVHHHLQIAYSEFALSERMQKEVEELRAEASGLTEPQADEGLTLDNKKAIANKFFEHRPELRISNDTRIDSPTPLDLAVNAFGVSVTEDEKNKAAQAVIDAYIEKSKSTLSDDIAFVLNVLSIAAATSTSTATQPWPEKTQLDQIKTNIETAQKNKAQKDELEARAVELETEADRLKNKAAQAVRKGFIEQVQRLQFPSGARLERLQSVYPRALQAEHRRQLDKLLNLEDKHVDSVEKAEKIQKEIEDLQQDTRAIHEIEESFRVLEQSPQGKATVIETFGPNGEKEFKIAVKREKAHPQDAPLIGALKDFRRLINHIFGMNKPSQVDFSRGCLEVEKTLEAVSAVEAKNTPDGARLDRVIRIEREDGTTQYSRVTEKELERLQKEDTSAGGFKDFARSVLYGLDRISRWMNYGNQGDRAVVNRQNNRCFSEKTLRAVLGKRQTRELLADDHRGVNTIERETIAMNTAASFNHARGSEAPRPSATPVAKKQVNLSTSLPNDPNDPNDPNSPDNLTQQGTTTALP